MSHVPNQARFYELQGSLHRLPATEADEEDVESRGPDRRPSRRPSLRAVPARPCPTREPSPSQETGTEAALPSRIREEGRGGEDSATDRTAHGTHRRADLALLARTELSRSTLGLEPVPHSGTVPPPPRAARRGRTRLPVWVRVSLIVVAVLLAAVGIAGLVLPGLQGVLTLLLALAVLSLVSRTMHALLRWALRPWPTLRKRVERHRRKSRNWLHDQVERLAAWRAARRERRAERRGSQSATEPGSSTEPERETSGAAPGRSGDAAEHGPDAEKPGVTSRRAS